jgi:hypothetical protein
MAVFILVGAMVAWMEGIPQGLKLLFSFPLERPKAEALGYPPASARQRQLQKAKADPYGMTTKKVRTKATATASVGQRQIAANVWMGAC